MDLFCNESVDATIEYPDGRIVRGKALIVSCSIEAGPGERRGPTEIALSFKADPSFYTVETDEYREECRRLKLELRRLGNSIK